MVLETLIAVHIYIHENCTLNKWSLSVMALLSKCYYVIYLGCCFNSGSCHIIFVKGQVIS